MKENINGLLYGQTSPGRAKNRGSESSEGSQRNSEYSPSDEMDEMDDLEDDEMVSRVENEDDILDDD